MRLGDQEPLGMIREKDIDVPFCVEMRTSVCCSVLHIWHNNKEKIKIG